MFPKFKRCIDIVQESESEVDDSLDDLEKHLREKALRSMRKAQLSPSEMSWEQDAFEFSLSLSMFVIILGSA